MALAALMTSPPWAPVSWAAWLALSDGSDEDRGRGEEAVISARAESSSYFSRTSGAIDKKRKRGIVYYYATRG